MFVRIHAKALRWSPLCSSMEVALHDIGTISAQNINKGHHAAIGHIKAAQKA